MIEVMLNPGGRRIDLGVSHEDDGGRRLGLEKPGKPPADEDEQHDRDESRSALLDGGR